MSVYSTLIVESTENATWLLLESAYPIGGRPVHRLRLVMTYGINIYGITLPTVVKFVVSKKELSESLRFHEIEAAVGGHQCGGIGMNFLTHTRYTRTRSIVCACNTTSPHMYNVCSWPLACCCAEVAPHTDTTLQLPLHSQLCLNVYKIVVYGW